MIYRTESTAKGSRTLEVVIDDRLEKVFFDVSFAIYGTLETKGKYRKYTFTTLKAANKKFDDLEVMIK
jgi:hypothetical protein